MADSHASCKHCELCLIKDLIHEALTSHTVKLTIISDSNNTASLLTSVLESMQTIIRKTCCIIYTIDSKNTTLMVKLVIPEFIVTLTHFRFYFRFSVKPG